MSGGISLVPVDSRDMGDGGVVDDLVVGYAGPDKKRYLTARA